jgi:hypothetical protein
MRRFMTRSLVGCAVVAGVVTCTADGAGALEAPSYVSGYVAVTPNATSGPLLSVRLTIAPEGTTVTLGGSGQPRPVVFGPVPAPVPGGGST